MASLEEDQGGGSDCHTQSSGEHSDNEGDNSGSDLPPTSQNSRTTKTSYADRVKTNI